MWKLMLSQKDSFVLKKLPEHEEGNFHSRDENFLPIFQKYFLYSLEKKVK